MADVMERTFRSEGRSITLRQGQAVWLLQTDPRESQERTANKPSVQKGTVVQLGRKYATVRIENSCLERKFFLPEYDTNGAMVESTEIGYALWLFPSENALKAHVERERLLQWVKTEGSRMIEHASLEQLGAMYAIFHPEKNEKEETT